MRTEQEGPQRPRAAWLGLAVSAADQAVDRLVEANEDVAQARVEAVDRITRRSIAAATAIALTAIAYAIWLVLWLRSRITRPLETTTEVLSELARRRVRPTEYILMIDIVFAQAVSCDGASVLSASIQVHLAGNMAKALMLRAGEMQASPPSVEPVDILGLKNQLT